MDNIPLTLQEPIIQTAMMASIFLMIPEDIFLITLDSTSLMELEAIPEMVQKLTTDVTGSSIRQQNANQEGKWKILRQLNDIDADGTYHWEYETENRIQAEEKGKLHNAGTDNEILRAKGFYEYIGPDNVKYSIYYTADENGFVAQGDHLPTPPPIPTYQ